MDLSRDKLFDCIIQAGIAYYSEVIKGDDPNDHEMPEIIPKDYTGNENEQWYLRAAEALNITIYNIQAGLETAKRVQEHVNKFESRFGRSPRLRLCKDLAFSLRDNQAFSLRDFRVLCSVYTLLGDSKYRILRRERINAMATGATKVASDQLEFLGIPQLTVKQLRNSLDRLHGMNFFARVLHWNRRNVYYSNSMNEQQLIKKITFQAPPRKSATILERPDRKRADF